MKPRNSTAIRAPGQRSIPSTFLFRPALKCSTSYKESSDAPSDCAKNRSNLSLSAFLNRKLHFNSLLPIDKEKNTSDFNEVKKEKVLQSVDQDCPNESIFRDDRYGLDGLHEEHRPVIEDSVFKLFNDTQGGKVRTSSSEGFTGTALARSERVLKKHSRNHLVVLGDDPQPKPKRRGYADVSCSNKKSRPLYNHYENGTGWWEPEREGVDSDEVGSKEVWEGMGTTTLGGLDWH